MKRRIIATLLSACIAVCVCFLPASETAAQNNDEKYDSYNNMSGNTTGHAKYIVPNLYRQDASYINVKTFPLVVNGSVEYFPLDIFALYPYLQVVYSKLTEGFYINNTKNNHYIAFDMENGTTTTHDSQLQDIQPKIFNRTYYVPAARVCEILGMNFETYDDPVNGIRAARVSDDKAKMTLSQLVTAYSPVKKEQSDNGDGKSDSSDGKDSGTKQDEIEKNPANIDGSSGDKKPADPFETVAERHIYLTFDVSHGASTESILDVLHKSGISALFFVDTDDILSYPDTVRRMIAEGHSVGIDLKITEPDGTVPDADTLILRLNDVNDSLYLVTKTKTRIVVLDKAGAGTLVNKGFADAVKSAGFDVLEWNVSAPDDVRYNTNQSDFLKTVFLGKDYTKRQSFVVKFGTYQGTDELLQALVEFSEKYPKFIISKTDEYTGKV